MQKRITKTISIYPETQEALNELTKATGLGESELIREMISKLASDRVGLTILISNFLNREGEHLTRERLLRIMSNRKSLKKDDPAQRGPSTVSSNSRLNDSINSKKNIDLKLNAGENSAKVFDYLTDAELGQVAFENWRKFTIEELKTLALQRLSKIAKTPWVEDY